MVYSLSLSRCLLKNSDKAEVCSSWNSKVVDMIELLKVQFGQFHVLPFYFNILGLDLAFGLLRHRETQRLSVHPLLTIPTVEFPTSVLPFLHLPLSFFGFLHPHTLCCLVLSPLQKGMKACEFAIPFPEHLTRSLVSEGINARNTIITGKPLICWGVCGGRWGVVRGCAYL